VVRDCLGLDVDEHGQWNQEAGPTVFAAFDDDTDYFGSREQQTMLNFRVRDLDAMLAQLRSKGAAVVDEDAGHGGRRSLRLGRRPGGESDRAVAASLIGWMQTTFAASFSSPPISEASRRR
jgi:hypothetical protein